MRFAPMRVPPAETTATTSVRVPGMWEMLTNPNGFAHEGSQKMASLMRERLGQRDD
jgi:hypothetical protein